MNEKKTDTTEETDAENSAEKIHLIGRPTEDAAKVRRSNIFIMDDEGRERLMKLLGS